MIILGVDPGTATTGYGLIEIKSDVRPIEYGLIHTLPHKELSERLRRIYQNIKDIVERHNPQEIAVEEVFFCRNAKSAISVGQAQGVIVLAASWNKGKVFRYTPLQVKQTITGYGRAAKSQVQYRVRELLQLPELPSDDAADALAVALCHYYSRWPLRKNL
jgi:crossover junction endodeoxyribonuclease RuvC